MSLYRIWWSDSNDRNELARAKATDIDQVIEFVKAEFLKPETELYDIDYQEYGVYMMIDACKDCEFKDCRGCDPELEADINREQCRLCLEYKATVCENCEHSEYIEIQEDPDTEPELKTIFGTNDYHDLTDPQQPEQPQVYNEFLHEAWKQSPRLGVSALIIQTIKDHPELEQAFSKDLTTKSKENTQHPNQ